ncbi:hypothetical protein LDENG_00093460 [Lucifuga dentata]|nr:hypothetical protein LDENG_00093460 [Lucifuga dentata]
MYLLDSSCAGRMERGTLQRKTVYRISLTLVKRESLEDGGGGGDEGDGGSESPRPENPKAGSFRRESSAEIQRSFLLEQLEEVEDESESSPLGYMRNFRTFSTGQLELGRMRICNKHHFHKELKESAGGVLTENMPALSREEKREESRAQENQDSDGLKEEVCAEAAARTLENGGIHKKKRLMKAKSAEERSCEENGDEKTSHAKSNGKAAKASPDAPPVKRPAGLLRRSFSFRHWSGGELLRLRALAKDKHHSSSGCIGHDARAGGGRRDGETSTALRNPVCSYTEPPREKSRTLEVGAVLNKTDSMSELSRWERARGGKNRTLDNSDLLSLAAEKDGAGGGAFLLRGGGGRSSERRLLRFFSGIFSRRDGATTSTPVGSPRTNRSLRQTRRVFLSQSSTESVNAGANDGKNTPPHHHLICCMRASAFPADSSRS